MTRDETIKIMMMIQATYPQMDVPDKTYTINMWTKIFAEEDYSVVEQALIAFIRSDTKGFPPSPGQIVEKIQFINKPENMGEMEAWSIVSKALRRCSYYSEEEYEKLPEIIQKVVGSPSQLRTWAIDSNYNEQVVSSNFMRSYRSELESEKQIGKLGSAIATSIDERKVELIDEI